MYKYIFSLIFVIVISTLLLITFSLYTKHGYLEFSDAAKFANIAKNIYQGAGYYDSFSYFGAARGLPIMENGLFPATWVPVAFPYILSLVYRLLGVNDFSVIFTSAFFFILLVTTIFILGRKMFDRTVGILSSLAVASNVAFLDYATQGGTETLFTFEITATTLMFFLAGKARIIGYLLLVAMYLTRPQAFIYIVLLIFYDLAVNSKDLKGMIKRTVLLASLSILAVYIISTLTKTNIIYPIWGRAVHILLQFTPENPYNLILRSNSNVDISQITFIQTASIAAKKLFYNLYNFYKLIPQIMSPYLFALFLLSCLVTYKDKRTYLLKIVTILMFIMAVVSTALSIPFFRYIHPTLPLVYIYAIYFIVKTIYSLKLRYQHLTIAIIFIVLCVGQTLGTIFLDTRFRNKNLVNLDKPPVYYILSNKLKELSKPSDVIITNLDTWGSWYGERKTVWFPIYPDQLKPKDDLPIADAIYLTSYLIDDPSYFMGEEWRSIMFNPDGHSNKFIKDNYQLVTSFNIKPDENYTKEDIKAVLFIKK
jgi:4-amino-4-deoxy-L-arabinose transferase-like glycosyltransferase